MRRQTYYLRFPRSLRFVHIYFILSFLAFVGIQLAFIRFLTASSLPSSLLTRLYQDMPMMINLRSYSVCHPKELGLNEINQHYHRQFPHRHRQACFLIENLDGEPWWSYVSHEFAEILTSLDQIGKNANIIYRNLRLDGWMPFETNLTEWFLNACDFTNEEILYKMPIVILFWNVDHFHWFEMRTQWSLLLANTPTRLLVFIDDLHFTTTMMFKQREYLFKNIATEIISTYAYLFQNYYTNISSSKITWMPHAASYSSPSSHSLPRINESAQNVLFVSGANSRDWYPCRARAFDLCEFRPSLVACLPHPGYGPGMRNGSSFFYGGTPYFSYMQKYAYGLATCQSVRYAIAKLFELPANGLTLVTTHDLIPILERLHLYHNEHFLTIDCSSVMQLSREIIRLQHLPNEQILQMRRSSQKIIQERHMTRHRAELLHVRLVAQALLAFDKSDDESTQWWRWGRDCKQS